jgi:hypothetical protein
LTGVLGSGASPVSLSYSGYIDDRAGPLHLATLYTYIILGLSQQPTVAQERLARRLGVTMRTAQRHLMHLEEEGFINVNWATKPFRYTIDWSRAMPYLSGLRLVLFHPAVVPLLQHLSDAAPEVYDHALKEQRDPAEMLQQLLIARRSLEGARQH